MRIKFPSFRENFWSSTILTGRGAEVLLPVGQCRGRDHTCGSRSVVLTGSQYFQKTQLGLKSRQTNGRGTNFGVSSRRGLSFQI